MPLGVTLTSPHAFSIISGQRQSGEVVPAASVKHISHRRFLATFQLDEVSKGEQDLYRCVTQSSRGAGVSNFAELIVKGGCCPWASLCVVPRLLITPGCRGVSVRAPGLCLFAVTGMS